ncbi:uncharacterized protein involved in type VI secretion and phage assembly [Enterobacter sp. BIGb0383]|uniref:phage baseplate assembly protein V n=1 Tax=unclassified Enterobacter TaxID=2608935 RepID=UPI000F465394|nr:MULTISPECIES: phage baseplate assembly protein V [unclassified Enterobacter]ROP62295.1 uncharacterized protein involved in type VI secretion and phage assembly [Enterobacter sp. BIGb0383]ROS12456.1 uncharacterized protein involved in type VI secretion and phage assembly [Enterobacter sp. BIGb0359]
MNEIVLKIGGKVCSLGISRLRVAQQINAIPSARLELQIPTDSKDTLAQSAVADISPGAAVLIELDGTPLFSGTLTQKRLLLRGKLWSVRLEARHVLQKLAFYPHSRVFRQQDDGTILNALFQQAGVKMTRTATPSATRHDQMVQFRVSDWQFILSRLFATNSWLLPDAASSSVTVSQIAAPASAAHTLERYAEYSDYTLHEIDLTFDNRFTPDSLSLRGWDVAEQKLGSAQKSGSDTFHPWKAAGQGVTLSRQPDYQLAFSTMPETQLNTLSRSWINHQQLTGVQGRIVLDGTRDFRLGESVKLDKFGAGLDGTAMLTGINQLFNTEDGWRSELLAGLPADFTDPVPSVQSLHIATVADFTVDPEQLDRIPISLPALNLPGEHIFARLGKPWASKASGFCFYPEPGDEVVVGFIESDPRYPVILDSLHNPKNSAPFPPDAQNLRKELVVSKDDYTAQLQINTEEKTVTLASGNNSLTLTADQNFQLTTPDEMTFTAKSISFQASEKLSASGESQVEITSASINLKK